jgi:transcriptional regulator with XRE-family HTH domain
MTDSEALGTLIRTSRLDKGLSLGQLASVVGRSPSSVRRWERGESVPSSDVISNIAAALDLDEEELGAIAAAAQSHQAVIEPTPVSDEIAEESAQAPAPIARAKTTIEDENVVVESVPYFETPAPVGPPPVQRQPSRYGRVSSSLWGRRDSWIGWVRGFFTLLALVFLFIGLMWALGELWTALREVLSSFSTGA